MKTSLLFMAILLIVGCTPDRYLHGRSDLRDVLHPKIDSSSVSPGTPLKGKRGIDLRQREIYVSAVSFPAGYNWRKDSLGGPEGCRIVLFRAALPDEVPEQGTPTGRRPYHPHDSASGRRPASPQGTSQVQRVEQEQAAALVFEEVLSIPVGHGKLFSTDPDMHHLIEGHLYAEASTSTETVIFRDAEELIRFPGREFLRGIYEAPDGGPVYTLTQNRDGPGFHFRTGQEVVIAQSGGVVSGGFSEINYNRHGGLNLNSDNTLEFSYLTGGETTYVSDSGKSGDSWLPDRGVVVRYSGSSIRLDIPDPGGSLDTLGLSYLPDGRLLASGNMGKWEQRFPPGNWYLFPTEGIALLEKKILLALTPISPDSGPPAVWTGDELAPVPVNGFLTGVEVVERGLD